MNRHAYYYVGRDGDGHTLTRAIARRLNYGWLASLLAGDGGIYAPDYGEAPDEERSPQQDDYEDCDRRVE